MTGAPKPLLAIVGTAGSPPAAMGVPQGLTLEVPGAGPLTTRRVAALPGEGLQVALSNVVGAWAEHYGVTDLEHLAILVDRNDGLQVELPEEVTLGSDVLGPGSVRMTGAQVCRVPRRGEPEHVHALGGRARRSHGRRRRSWSRAISRRRTT